MFRFLLRFACFVLAAALLIGLVSVPLLPKDGAQDPGKKNILLANTGNSHGMYAFDYRVMPEELFPENFAMESQSIVYDEKLVRYFEHHFAEEGAVLFVLVDMTSFWYEEREDADFNAKNERYLTMIGARNMRFKNLFETLMYRYFYLMTCMDRWTDTLFTIDSSGAESNPQLTLYSRAEIGRMRAAHHLKHILYEDGTLRPMIEENVQALQNILSFCKEKNIRPILLTTPYHAAYTCCVPPAVREKMIETVQSIADAHGVAWWDYFDAEPFHTTDAYFHDTDHLSAEGSRLFTEMLKERLLAEGYFTQEQLR